MELVSILTPGPIVVDTAKPLKYVPLAEAGFAFCKVLIKAFKFSWILSGHNVSFPSGA